MPTKLLIIEDNEADCMLYKRYLEKEHDAFLITIEAHADKALEFLKNNEVDCILLDYQLPQISGLEFLAVLKTEQFVETPVVMLTGQGDEKVAVQALKTGASDYLIKNEVTEKTLLQSIKQAISQANLKKQSAVKANAHEFMAYHDELTGVPNRRHFEALLRQALKRANRSQTIMALFMIDLDYFKKINDTLGHEAGDQLLKGVIERFKPILRETDTLSRLGGDEFALIVEHLKNLDDASIVAAKLTKSISEEFLLVGKPAKITISIGIAAYPLHAENEAEIIRYADKALYQAKNAGRNQFAYYKNQ